MLKKLIILLCSLFTFGINPSYLHELQKQYNDYLNLYNKKEASIETFEIFLKNLLLIQEYNNNNHCKILLTQYSDTLLDEYIYDKRCF